MQMPVEVNEESFSFDSEQFSEDNKEKNEIIEQEKEVNFLDQTYELNEEDEEKKKNIKKEEDIFLSLEMPLENKNEKSIEDNLKNIKNEEKYINNQDSMNMSEIKYFNDIKKDQSSNIYGIEYGSTIENKVEKTEIKSILNSLDDKNNLEKEKNLLIQENNKNTPIQDLSENYEKEFNQENYEQDLKEENNKKELIIEDQNKSFEENHQKPLPKENYKKKTTQKNPQINLTSKNIQNNLKNTNIIPQKTVINSKVQFQSPIFESSNLLNAPKLRPLKKKKIQIKIFVEEKTFPQIYHFEITGEITQNSSPKKINIIRRYKDFDFLNTIITQKFFYRVLPLIPEKDFLLKITNNKNLLEKRTRGLERYLNEILRIDEIKNFKIFKLFLFDQEKFQMVYTNLEFSSIYEKKGFLGSFNDKFSNVYNFVKNKGNLNYDTGYYSNFSKKIEGMFFFLKNIILNLKNLKTESFNLFQETRNCENYSGNKYNFFKNQFSDFQTKEKKFKQFFYILENILEDVNACKNSLVNKDLIYKQFHLCEQKLKNMGADDNNRFLIKKEFNDLKMKIEKMDKSLKEDLELRIHLINKNIEHFFQNEMKKGFQNLFIN